MGRHKAIETPEKLLELFQAYKAWAKENPYLWHDFVGKDAQEVWKRRERPITWVGFESYLYQKGICGDLGAYERNDNESYTDYLPILRAIKREINQDIIEGATAGIYQQNIAARLTGLVDRKEIEHTVPAPFLNNDPLSDGADTTNDSTS